MPIAGNQYLRPGVVIGQIVRPNPVALPDIPNLPLLVGRGVRLARGRNLALLRSFIVDEELTFSPVAPYRATLAFSTNQDKEDPSVRLEDDLGTEVSKADWFFSDANTVEISPAVYDANRTYSLDYQSSARTPLDPIPVNDIRGKVTVSTKRDQDEFEENVDFFLPVTMAAAGQSAGVLAPTTANSAPVIDPAAADGGNVGFDGVDIAGGAQFTHAYSRSYTVRCEDLAGASPNRVATFSWSSAPVSGGNGAAPHSPTYPGEPLSWNFFQHDENADGASRDETLEFGLQIQTAFDGVDFAIGDTWTFTVHAAPRVEVDRRHLEDNQYQDLGTVTPGTGNTGTGSGVVNQIASNFTGDAVREYFIECIETAGLSPNRVATLVVSSYGESGDIATATYSLVEGLPSMSTTLPGGVVVDWSFGGVHFDSSTLAPPAAPVQGDVFRLTVRPPRIFTSVKDDRTYVLQVSAVTDLAPGTEVTGTYLTDTPEGRFGSFTATADGYANVTGSTTGLPDEVRLRFRNLEADFADNLFSVDDQFTFSITNQDVIDWSLTARRTEVLAPADFLFDPLGRVTGTINTWYALLERVPTDIVTVNDGTAEVAYTQVAGTGYIVMTAQPAGNITVTYEWRSAEPAPGQTYYLTANYVRTADLFNDPILVQSAEAATDLLAPMSASNDLLIGALAALSQNPVGIYVMQVADADGDGLYTDADYRTTLALADEIAGATDLVVLNRWNVLGDALTVVDERNDPVESKFTMLWAGAPRGTLIGDPETSGTLIHTAQNALAVYGESNSHGTRVLHAATECTTTITLPSGQTQQVTLDGSFVSALLAGMAAVAGDNDLTILRQTFGFFDSIQTYTEAEERRLGASQIIYFRDLGSGVFRVEENFTTDNFSEQYRYVNVMKTQHYMSKFVGLRVDTAIGLIPPSIGEGADTVRGLVAQALRDALAAGRIAEYQNADGSTRRLNVDSDILAFGDPGDSTRVQFRFTYFLKYVLKNAIGLYTTDGNPFN